MADVPIVNRATTTAPKDYTLPQSQEILLRAVRADIDGTGAAGVFLPALQLLSPDGVVMWTAVDPNLSVAAGASASVSWFPGVTSQAIASGSGIPPFPALDDYVFKHANTTVTGVGFNDTTALVIQGNPISLDGATRIKVEFFTPLVELTNSAQVANQAIGFSLWDGATNKGVIAYVEAGNYTKFTGASAASFGGPVYGAIILTPSAGTHTYAVYAFLNVAAGGGTYTVYANTFVDGTGNLAPCWYRVTST